MMKKLKKIIGFLPLILMAQLVYGQLLKVSQTVFGMDCAPCAYGVKQGLQKIAGVNSAKVSLNKGKAFITLDPVNHLTLAAIQKEIKDNGFSPRDANVEMKGILEKNNGRLTIQVQNEIFWVDDHSDHSALAMLNKTASGAVVTVAGHVSALSPKPIPVWRLSVEKIL